MRDSKSKTVIIYNRVSTIMQDKNESLTEQTDECIRYCKTNGYEIYKIALKKGAILRPLGNIVYFMPPYIITREEIDKMLDIFNESLREYLETID